MFVFQSLDGVRASVKFVRSGFLSELIDRNTSNINAVINERRRSLVLDDTFSYSH